MLVLRDYFKGINPGVSLPGFCRLPGTIMRIFPFLTGAQKNERYPEYPAGKYSDRTSGILPAALWVRRLLVIAFDRNASLF